MNELIARARNRYLSEHPVQQMSFPTVDETGKAGEPLTFPNIGDLQIIGCKLGMEYLAICHNEDAVEDWISNSIGIAKHPEMVGVLFANVFRGFNTVVAELTARPEIREHFQRMAVEAWNRDFSGGAA